jgi:hypothetical protein
MDPFALTLDEITTKLNEMQDDPKMHTVDAYSPAATAWPDSRMPFVEVHLAYLRAHKKVNASQYLSNLRLMIKKA